MGDLGGIATQARQTRQAFRGVLLPKTHGSTERLRRREQIGSIDKYTRYVSINKIIFMLPSEFLYNNSVKLVIPVLHIHPCHTYTIIHPCIHTSTTIYMLLYMLHMYIVHYTFMHV